MTKKTDYVAWGLDEATPTIIDETLEKRQQIFNKITSKLDRIAGIILLSTIAQVALIAVILTKL